MKARKKMNITGPSYPMASLYVGDLHPDVTEAMLYEKFSSAGRILSIRVCKDVITHRSLGYAYVNFQQPADAEQALNTMNSDVVEGRPIRIMWSHRDPSGRKSGVASIFLENLDKTFDNKALYDTFSAFGNIQSYKIACDDQGSKGYGFVHFETEEAARQAVDKVNGMLLNGKKVYVGHLGDKKQHFHNVYVKNFGDELDDEKLHDMFASFGKIISAKVMVSEDGKSRGFGFVSFEESEGAEKAVESINGMEVGGRTIYCSKAQKRAERQAELRERFEKIKMERNSRYKGLNLYVKNLDDNIDDERLRKEFSDFGTITSARVMTEGGRSKGFGFVCFSSPEEATKAITEMNGRIIEKRPLYVAFHQTKEDRRAQLASRYMQHKLNLCQQQSAQHSRMFQPGPGNFFIPAMAQSSPNRFYTPHAGQMPLRHSPGWNTSNFSPGVVQSAPYQFYTPYAGQMPIHPGPRSNTPVHPVQRTAGFQGMRPTQMCPRAPYSASKMATPERVDSPPIQPQISTDLKRWARSNELPEETVLALVTEGFTSIADLKLHTPEEIFDLFVQLHLLPLKECLALRKALQTLGLREDVPVSDDSLTSDESSEEYDY